jgi:hypothetical protein
MEYVQLTLICCRHAVVLVRHGWSRLAATGGVSAWHSGLRARARLKADG